MDRQEEFQKLIGYEFQDPKILRQALTHSSYANEKYWNWLPVNFCI